MNNLYLPSLQNRGVDDFTSDMGIKIRRCVSPAFRLSCIYAFDHKIVVDGYPKLEKDTPYIFASSHGFVEVSDCYKLKTLNISNLDINKLTGIEGMLYANFVLNKVIMNNSDYTFVNKIITNIESKTSESIGTISITGVDNISKVYTTTANCKYWNII